MYEKLFRRYLEGSEGLLPLLAPAVADFNLRDLHRACDTISYSES